MQAEDLTIEHAAGKVFSGAPWAVYAHGQDTDGKTSKRYVGRFPTPDEALAAYPDADVISNEVDHVG